MLTKGHVTSEGARNNMMLFLRGPEITLAPGQRWAEENEKDMLLLMGVRNNMVLFPKGSELTSAWAPAISTNPDKRICYF